MFGKEDICRSLGRSKEIWSIDSEALKEWGCNEMGGIGFDRGERAKLELSIRGEAEDAVRERMEEGEEIFGDSMVGYVEESPVFAGFREGGYGRRL